MRVRPRRAPNGVNTDTPGPSLRFARHVEESALEPVPVRLWARPLGVEDPAKCTWRKAESSQYL